MPKAPRLAVATLLAGIVPFAALAAGTAAPIAVSEADHVALAPDVAVGPRGEIAVLWLDRGVPAPAPKDGHPAEHTHLSSMDLYVAIAADGSRFGPPQRVNRADGEVWGFAVSRPRIAYGPTGTLHVAYPANEMQDGIGKPVLTMHYTRSTDGGRTFEAPRRVSTLTDADLSGVIHGGFASVAAFGTMGVAPDGGVHIIWIDTRHMRSEKDDGSIYGVVSRDDGRSFTQDRVEAADGVCPCCQLSLAFDAKSHAYLGSRLVTADGVRMSTVARAEDGTGKFTRRIGTGGAPWHIDGCPLKPTVLAVRGDAVYTAAHNGAETPPGVMLATSLDDGASFGPAIPAHPGAAVSDAPAIAIAGDAVIVAWHAKTDGPRRVFYRTLDATGAPVGDPVALTDGAETSQSAALASRPDGRAQIAWQEGQRIYTTAIEAARP